MSNSTLLRKIKTRREKMLNSGIVTANNLHRERQQRLKTLVEKYGVECVAAASGLSESTVQHYCRLSTPPIIGENSIYVAECVLEGL